MYLLWVAQVPVALYANAGHDDALFLERAYHIVEGNWLGPYDNLTLAKGPAFPIVLALNHLLGTPITLVLALLHLLATCLVSWSLARIGLHRYLVVALFLVVLFHPALVPARMTRDSIYASLTLLTVAGALRVAGADDRRKRSLGAASLFGAAAGLFWVNREEGLWIVPGMAVLLVFGLASGKKNRTVTAVRALHSGVFVGTAVVFVALVALANLFVYGRFMVTDFRDPSFTAAVDTLNGVKAGREVSYVPVPREKREAIYAVSPSFRQLRGNLDGRENGWKSTGCAVYPHSCGDFAGGWWVWALRDAVAEQGHYESPSKAAEFYDRLTQEVDQACATGRLSCQSSPIPLMPDLTNDQVGRMPDATWRSIQLLTLQHDVQTPSPSTEPLDELTRMRDFLGHPVSTPAVAERRGTVHGWYRAEGDSWLQVVCPHSTGEQIQTPLEKQPSPDLVEAFGDVAAGDNRFSMEIPKQAGCWLSADGVVPGQMPFSALLATPPPVSHDFGGGTLYLDSVVSSQKTAQWPTDLLVWLGSLYRLLLTMIAVTGAIAFAAAIPLAALHERHRSGWLVVAAAMWILVLGRVAVLVLVDTSSFPAINTQYMTPAFPLLVAASFVSLQWLAALRPPRRRSRVPSREDRVSAADSLREKR